MKNKVEAKKKKRRTQSLILTISSIFDKFKEKLNKPDMILYSQLKFTNMIKNR